MLLKGILQRVRGLLGNAVVWGAGWSLMTIPVMGVLYLGLGVDFFPLGLASRIALNLFGLGFLAGGAFSTYLGLAYRHKGFHELRPGLFAVVGGVFAGLLVPLFTLVPGLGMFLGGSFTEAMIGSVALVSAMGGATAFSTVKMAEAAALSSGSDGWSQLAGGE